MATWESNHEQSIARRAILTGLAAAFSILFLFSSVASATTAQSADSFVSSIGVNVHLGYYDTAYNQFPAVREKLDQLGVRYIRDGISQNTPPVYARLRTLAGDGIKADLIVGDPLERWGSGTLENQLALIERELGPSVVATLEGPNEYDLNSGDPNWASNLRSYTQHLWEGAKARPGLSSIPILAPSLVNPASYGQLGNVSAWTSEGNLHPYPSANIPDSDGQMGEVLRQAATDVPAEPTEVTESGYTNAVNSTSGQTPTSEKAAGIYMPRLFLDNFRRGITRTYAYELIDKWNDPGRTDTESNFGLLRNNLTEKPAYTALRNLISLLADPGPTFTPGSLAYTLAGAPPATRQLLLQKRDGSFYLALWNPISAWNPQTRTDLAPQDSTATLSIGQPIAEAQVYRPSQSANPTTTVSNVASLTVPVGTGVTVVKLKPGADSVVSPTETSSRSGQDASPVAAQSGGSVPVNQSASASTGESVSVSLPAAAPASGRSARHKPRRRPHHGSSRRLGVATISSEGGDKQRHR